MNSCCFTSSSAFNVVSVFNLAILTDVYWYLIVLTRISQVTHDTEQLLICLFAISIYFW